VYKATIRVTLRPSILDPQGKATQHALGNLGFGSVKQVRVGKYIEMQIEADSIEAATSIAEESCAKLLANPVMEDYAIDVEEV
jgi:phosphoribosylformylglycinamidine synthase